MLVLGLYSIGAILFLFLVLFIGLSYKETEHYAVRRILTLLPVVLLFFVPIVLPADIGLMYAAFILVFVGCTTIWLLWPGKFPFVELDLKNEEHDERLTLFSRYYELKPGESKYLQFYEEFSHLKEGDDKLRNMPGLFSEKSLAYHPGTFQKANRYAEEIEQYFPFINDNKDIGKEQAEINYALKKSIVHLAKSEGAAHVGFTPLEDYHFYSVRGRGEQYGNLVDNKHSHAVAITVEMNKEKMDYAPYAPVVEESTLQYLNAARIATRVAELIRSKGYEAKTHIDQNYDVICPLVARDAGLGDIGRMGLLMTQNLGPRVRIAVVSTNMPLGEKVGRINLSTQYFCAICKKCATVCPSGAIPTTSMQNEGKVRYKIDHEKCFKFWCQMGTDCGRCMQVCPYSHPDKWMHNLVRWLITRNRYAALFALYADNYIYGRKPVPRKPE